MKVGIDLRICQYIAQLFPSLGVRRMYGGVNRAYDKRVANVSNIVAVNADP